MAQVVGILTVVMATIGENIKRLRPRAGFKTQGALALAIGVPQSRMSDWENGRYESIETENLVSIAKAIGVSIDELLAGVDPVYDKIAHGDTTRHGIDDGVRSPGKVSTFSPATQGETSDVDALATRIRELEGRIEELQAYEVMVDAVRPHLVDALAAVGGPADRAAARPPARGSRRRPTD